MVTGASSGIGAAFARALHARGRPLVLVARRADRLARLAAELGGEAGAIAIPLDLSLPDAGERLERALAERGVSVDLNVRAVIDLTRRFLPPMVARGGGAVINVASTSAFQPVSYLAVYAATKVFVLSFTEALAGELAGTGVTVQALCPGLTESEFHQTAGTDQVLFTKTGMMSAEAVVERSLRALDRGTLRVIAGWQNRLVVGVQRFAPQALVRAVAGRLFRPRTPARPPA